MDTKLVIVEGKASKDHITVKLPTTIGRSREAGLTVAHPMISRQHCELFEIDGLVKVRDLESLNGTFVGSEQVGESPLLPNALFTVGPLTFRVVYEYSGDPNAISPPEPPSKTLESPAFVPEAENPVEGPVQIQQTTLNESLTTHEPSENAQPAKLQPANNLVPGIAPTNGELPDFESWGSADTGQIDEDEQEQAEPEPTPPPPPPSKKPAVQESVPSPSEAPAVQESVPSPSETPAVQESVPSLSETPAVQESVPSLSEAPAVQESVPSLSETPAVQESVPSRIEPSEPEPAPVAFFEKITPLEEELASEASTEDPNANVPTPPPTFSPQEEELATKPPGFHPTPSNSGDQVESTPSREDSGEADLSDFLKSMSTSSESDDDDLNDFFRGIKSDSP